MRTHAATHHTKKAWQMSLRNPKYLLTLSWSERSLKCNSPFTIEQKRGLVGVGLYRSQGMSSNQQSNHAQDAPRTSFPAAPDIFFANLAYSRWDPSGVIGQLGYCRCLRRKLRIRLIIILLRRRKICQSVRVKLLGSHAFFQTAVHFLFPCK